MPAIRLSAKKFSKKKLKNLCRVPAGLALGKAAVNGAGAVTVPFLCRVLTRHSAKPLPSARQKALGKGCFADKFFSECPLPSVALGKAFAECKGAFAECLRHSAKSRNPVVHARLWFLIQVLYNYKRNLSASFANLEVLASYSPHASNMAPISPWSL